MNVQHHPSLPQRRSLHPRRASAHPSHIRATNHYTQDPRVQGTLSFPARNVGVPSPHGCPSATSNVHQLDPRAIAHLLATPSAIGYPSPHGFSAHQVVVLPAHDTASEQSTWEFTAPKKSKRKSIQKADGQPTEAQRVAMEYLQAQAQVHSQSKPVPPLHQSFATTSGTHRIHKSSTTRPSAGLEAHSYGSNTFPRIRRSSTSAADRPAILPSNGHHHHRRRRNSTTATVAPVNGYLGIANVNLQYPTGGQFALPAGFQPTGVLPLPQSTSRSRRISSNNLGLPRNLPADDSGSRRTSTTTSKQRTHHHAHTRPSSSSRSRRESVPERGRKPSHDRSHKHEETKSKRRSSSKSRERTGSTRKRKPSRVSRYGPFSIGAEAIAVRLQFYPKETFLIFYQREEAHTVMDRFKAHEGDPLPCRRDGCSFEANNVEGLGVHILNAHVSEPYVLPLSHLQSCSQSLTLRQGCAVPSLP